MRCPDPEAGGYGGHRQPHASHLTAGFLGMAKQIDRGKWRQHADQGRETDQPQIVGVGNAGVNLEHVNDAAMAEIPQSRATLGGKSVRWGKCVCSDQHDRATPLHDASPMLPADRTSDSAPRPPKLAWGGQRKSNPRTTSGERRRLHKAAKT